MSEIMIGRPGAVVQLRWRCSSVVTRGRAAAARRTLRGGRGPRLASPRARAGPARRRMCSTLFGGIRVTDTRTPDVAHGNIYMPYCQIGFLFLVFRTGCQQAAVGGYLHLLLRLLHKYLQSFDSHKNTGLSDIYDQRRNV